VALLLGVNIVLICCFFTLQHFKGLSFPTISSVGPNAAIIHYGPDPETCAEMDPDSIYLFDSGAQVYPHFNQGACIFMIFCCYMNDAVSDALYAFDAMGYLSKYQDGTTDITRTVHFGRPSAHERSCFTEASPFTTKIFYNWFPNPWLHTFWRTIIANGVCLYSPLVEPSD